MNNNKNCQVEPLEKPLDQAALSTARAALMTISGMGCPRCAMRVRNGLLSLDGVLLADVNLERGVAAVAFNPEEVNRASLETAVFGAGDDGRHHYQARVLLTMPANEAFDTAT
jgi:copper chaperone CopZ